VPLRPRCALPLAATLFALSFWPSPARGQSRPPDDPLASSLARGWAAYAAGQFDEAARIADEALALDARDHAAIELKVRARASRTPAAGLDTYEGWLATSGVEDPFLVRPVARRILWDLASGSDETIRLAALQRLAGAGDRAAADRLADAAAATSAAIDAQLALHGNRRAAERLAERPDVSTVRPETLAEALSYSGPAGVPRLRELLKHPAPPVRAAAALALGRLGPDAGAARAQLEAMFDDPAVRSFVAVPLARLGHAGAEALMQEFLQSPVADLRLLAAQAYAGSGAGAWSEALRPLLDDPNGLTRVRAAELLLPVARDEALAALAAASAAANPVVRADVTRVLELAAADAARHAGDACSVGDLGILRRQLRDADPSVRLHAAGGILTRGALRGTAGR
jgi:hypothetical protein